MDFEQQSEQLIAHMAHEFAGCQDEKKIGAVLETFHRLWVAELKARLLRAAEIRNLQNQIGNINASN